MPRCALLCESLKPKFTSPRRCTSVRAESARSSRLPTHIIMWAPAVAPIAPAFTPITHVAPYRAQNNPLQRHHHRRRLSALLMAADDDFEVTIKRPLGIQLADKPDVGVVVAAVGDGSNAKAAGVAVGDVVLATSATMGASMWPKNTVDGVGRRSARGSTGACGCGCGGRTRRRSPGSPARGSSRLIDTFEVELSQPLGMVLREREDEEDGGGGEGSSSGSEAVLTAYGQGVANLGSSSSSSAEDDDDDDLDASSGIVEVAEVAAGGSAAASGRIRAGDVVLATSGTLGDKLWEKSTLEGVLAAISTRLALSPTVTLRLSRDDAARAVGVRAACDRARRAGAALLHRTYLPTLPAARAP